ncbi:TnsA endonuclease N-terminal domain-containing protein [Ornithinibacillus contaminans]|uniref:TnsA endonuclease N-terminal domain-containing protein n=1 Tax=Ornithinibacillus contaminans TaxID=694055 RepID=UPI00064DAAAB|nr:TnsA endonuclease N-terminal domain-containing protein [Ornithinibacillus contaminans]
MYSPVVDPSKKHYGANFWDSYSNKINRDVHFYSDLEYDHWIHIETNPNVVDFCEKPMKIKGIIDGKIHETTFDMWIKWKDGNEEFIEVAYNKDVLNRKDTKRRIFLQREWIKNNNRNYRIVDETQVRKQPLLDNLKVILPYTKDFHKLNEISIFSLLRYINEKPATFQELIDNTSQKDVFTFYQNIFYLYYEGKINFNIEEQHFNYLTKVWRRYE